MCDFVIGMDAYLAFSVMLERDGWLMLRLDD